MKLPIDSKLEEIREYVSKYSQVILSASPGSGKTTRVPVMLARTFGKTLVLQPRRIAAKLASQFVASELGEPIGKSVGYRFRYENTCRENTLISFLTEGTFLRILTSNPELKGFQCVILDEFHERHLSTDVALALLLKLQSTVRKDLKIVIMSATLNVVELKNHMPQLIDLHVPGRSYPIEPHFLDKPFNDLTSAIRQCLRQIPKDAGDILVFLPGISEIRRTASALRTNPDYFVAELYGTLSSEAQTRVLEPQKKQKVILSTNVAESSVTIDGVRVVIDSGLHREASISPGTGLTMIRTKKICKASAEQRRGRAGRQAEGICYHLYSKSDLDGRPKHDIPEILRSDLSSTILDLKNLKIAEFGELQWLTLPKEEHIKKAEENLKQIGAISSTGQLTPIGKEIIKLPVEPKIARILITAKNLGVSEPVLRLCSLLQDPPQDFLSAVSAPPNREAMRLAKLMGVTLSHSNAARPHETLIADAFLSGFAQQVGKKIHVSKDTVKLQLFTGQGVVAKNHPVLVDHDYFIVTKLIHSHTGTRETYLATSVIPIDVEQIMNLTHQPMTEVRSTSWNQKKQRVEQKSQLCFGSIVIMQESDATQPGKETLSTLLKHYSKVPSELLVSGTPAQWLDYFHDTPLKATIQTFVAKWEICKKYQSEFKKMLEWKELRNGVLVSMETCLSASELESTDFEGYLAEHLSLDAHRFSMLLPNQVLLGKRKTEVRYLPGMDPMISSRLQDFFGIKQTPTILNGKIPLALELLAPNKRAVQTTRDLKSFWQNTYPEIRGPLSRRYPKHYWPENPLKNG